LQGDGAKQALFPLNVELSDAQNHVSLLKNGQVRVIHRHFAGLDLIFCSGRSSASQFCLTSRALKAVVLTGYGDEYKLELRDVP